MIFRIFFHVLRCLEEFSADIKVNKIQSMVKNLNRKVASRYGESSLVFNTHMFYHFSKFLQRFGPLMHMSIYLLASVNHYLGTYISGYIQGLKELSRRYFLFDIRGGGLI